MSIPQVRSIVDVLETLAHSYETEGHDLTSLKVDHGSLFVSKPNWFARIVLRLNWDWANTAFLYKNERFTVKDFADQTYDIPLRKYDRQSNFRVVRDLFKKLLAQEDLFLKIDENPENIAFQKKIATIVQFVFQCDDVCRSESPEESSKKILQNFLTRKGFSIKVSGCSDEKPFENIYVIFQKISGELFKKGKLDTGHFLFLERSLKRLSSERPVPDMLFKMILQSVDADSFIKELAEKHVVTMETDRAAIEYTIDLFSQRNPTINQFIQFFEIYRTQTDFTLLQKAILPLVLRMLAVCNEADFFTLYPIIKMLTIPIDQLDFVAEIVKPHVYRLWESQIQDFFSPIDVLTINEPILHHLAIFVSLESRIEKTQLFAKSMSLSDREKELQYIQGQIVLARLPVPLQLKLFDYTTQHMFKTMDGGLYEPIEVLLGWIMLLKYFDIKRCTIDQQFWIDRFTKVSIFLEREWSRSSLCKEINETFSGCKTSEEIVDQHQKIKVSIQSCVDTMQKTVDQFQDVVSGCSVGAVAISPLDAILTGYLGFISAYETCVMMKNNFELQMTKIDLLLADTSIGKQNQTQITEGYTILVLMQIMLQEVREKNAQSDSVLLRELEEIHIKVQQKIKDITIFSKTCDIQLPKETDVAEIFFPSTTVSEVKSSVDGKGNVEDVLADVASEKKVALLRNAVVVGEVALPIIYGMCTGWATIPIATACGAAYALGKHVAPPVILKAFQQLGFRLSPEIQVLLEGVTTMVLVAGTMRYFPLLATKTLTSLGISGIGSAVLKKTAVLSETSGVPITGAIQKEYESIKWILSEFSQGMVEGHVNLHAGDIAAEVAGAGGIAMGTGFSPLIAGMGVLLANVATNYPKTTLMASGIVVGGFLNSFGRRKIA